MLPVLHRSHAEAVVDAYFGQTAPPPETRAQTGGGDASSWMIFSLVALPTSGRLPKTMVSMDRRGIVPRAKCNKSEIVGRSVARHVAAAAHSLPMGGAFSGPMTVRSAHDCRTPYSPPNAGLKLDKCIDHSHATTRFAVSHWAVRTAESRLEIRVHADREAIAVPAEPEWSETT